MGLGKKLKKAARRANKAVKGVGKVASTVTGAGRIAKLARKGVGKSGIGKLTSKAGPFALGGITGGSLYNYVKKQLGSSGGGIPALNTQNPGEMFSSALRKRLEQRGKAAGSRGRSSTILGGGGTLLG